jgi:hypothetical protein
MDVKGIEIEGSAIKQAKDYLSIKGCQEVRGTRFREATDKQQKACHKCIGNSQSEVDRWYAYLYLRVLGCDTLHVSLSRMRVDEAV